ncbi:MAG TPA: molybdate ABC transporter substrate-binding protein [Terriglobia bacterium]|nr:molybdate ABC transporter substrate-binding protein [Terriglobia bacterium]
MNLAMTLLLTVNGWASGRAPDGGRQITVAAAADLTFVFKDVAARFEKQTGIDVRLSFGSSGNFFAQIQNGAPYDIFFSADARYPRQLESVGLIEPGTFYRYARGRIVLWAPKGSGIDVARGLGVLAEPAVRKIAIANPEHAPYGRAAVAALRHEGLYDQVRDKLVLGENISQAAQFVLSSGAGVGIVALSLALSPTMKHQGKFFEIPESSYPAIDQAAVILKSSRNKDAARRFLDFLRRPEIAGLMRSYGFALPASRAAGATP